MRGIKAGLPLLDCLRVIAIEAPEPVRSEFRAIVETQAIGMPLGEACGKLYERMPLPEANFFGIVISIQQKTGGNLSEALGNLSQVLRDRKKMKGKIKAMSMEAKASARSSAPAARGDVDRLHHQPRLHRAAVDGSLGQHDAGGSRGLDVHRHHGHAQDDQLRLLRRGMLDLLIAIARTTSGFMAMVFAAIAAVATVLTLAMPLLGATRWTSA